MNTILVPIDFSTVSNDVIKTATKLAKSVSARVLLLHVVQPPIITSEYGAVMTNVSEIIAISEESARRELERRRKRLLAAGVETAVAQAIGAPATSILDQAQKTKAAYIVIGSHGRSALYDLFAGSTAASVIRRASCPVVVVPAARGKKR